MNRRGLFKFLGGAAAAAPAIMAVAASTQGAQRRSKGPPPITGQTFVVEELFGVSHPDQLLPFAGALNPATQKVLKDGAEVPYQVDGNTTIVRATGGVAANTTHVWEVVEGARSAASQVSVTDGGDHWRVDNGLVAFKTPKTIAVGAPVNLDPESTTEQRIGGSLPNILAPLQGVRHRDGTWTGTGPNYLTNANTWRKDGSYGSINFPATSATVTVLESGPLRAKIRVAYGYLPSTSRRPPDSPIAPGQYLPPGPGYYNCTITLWAGQQSIMVEEEFDARPEYAIDMNVGVNADKVRYRGQGGGADGYPQSDKRKVDFDHEMSLGSTEQLYGPLYQWYTWATDNGYYWHAHNSAGSPSSNVWGIFQGPTTKIKTGHGSASGLRPYTDASGNHGFRVSHRADYLLEKKYSYGIFLGSKGADIPPFEPAILEPDIPIMAPIANPGVAKAMNLHSGTAQLAKMMSWGLDFNDPAGGYDGLYLSRADMEAIINDPGDHLDNDSGYQALWNAFANTSNAQASAMADDIILVARDAVDNYVNRSSIFNLSWIYWQAQLRFQSVSVNGNALLVLDQVRPFLTATQKKKLKAAMSLCGHVLWDNEFVPLDFFGDDGTFHAGTANMPLQFADARRQFAILLKGHPQFAARFGTITTAVVDSFNQQINAAGAPIGSPKYGGATIVPAGDVLRQLQVGGINDLFAPASSIHGRLTKLSEFLMQVLTPRQSRFGNRRKMVCYGDGSSEAHDYHLALIMGLEAHNPSLARRMMGSWIDMGKWKSSFYASSSLKIKKNFPSQDPALGDADFPGYMSVMRSGWNTANESAVFLLHGNHFIDHASYERGSPSIYLLGAPVTLNFGSLYDPGIGGPLSASTYVPVSKIPGTWNNLPGTDVEILNAACGDHSSYFTDTYTWAPTTNRTDLTCNFSVSGWQRRVTLYRDVVAQPVVRIRDSNAAGESVFSLNLMAKDAVIKPDGGTYTPSGMNGGTFSIPNGGCLKFTGQWGVSFDVYYFGPAAEAFIGFWGHNWHPAGEMAQYQVATGQPFEEKQYILRIKTAGPSDVVIVPYRTGQRRADLNLTQVGGGLQLMETARMLSD
jgi:hypothetical protein